MLPTLLVILTFAALYWFTLRSRFARWGTTSDELTRVGLAMRSSSILTHSATQAVTVDAPPNDIWPWLLQMAYEHGGLYSYDWHDSLLQ